jgi:hypothetical protein
MSAAGGYIQVALEEAPNGEHGTNPVSSVPFYLPQTSINFDPKFAPMDTSDELRGGLSLSPNKGPLSFAPAGPADGRLYPATVGFWLALACGMCTSTPGAGTSAVKDPANVNVPVGAYRHVFDWKSGQTPQTTQIKWAAPDGSLYWKAMGVGADKLDFTRNNGAWQVAATLLGLYANTIADPALTPSYETPGPWRAGQMALTWLASSAITDDFTWYVENTLAALSTVSSASLYPDMLVYNGGIPVLGGTIPKRSMEAADWNALIAGTQFAAMMHFIHSEDAVSGYKHQLWVDMPGCQYQAGTPDAIANQRVNKGSFDWEARDDATTGKRATITLVNATPTYATYAS